ncbi:MAG: lactate utilization protein [Deltaproteobacteria bacterium]|nr:lactate utilization protein [Deltaproteobacteria bacterium]
MNKPVENFWKLKLTHVKKELEKNNFEAFIAENGDNAKEIALKEIIYTINPGSISWGYSMTFIATGLYEFLKRRSDIAIIDPFDPAISKEENLERRRQGLLVDLFITGSNAVTETGVLVNLDGTGNRVAGLTFGPKHVIVFAGRNKIVSDVESARSRIKNVAAPANSLRLGRNTPCTKTSFCNDCQSPERICNSWVITEKSSPKGRVKVILINSDMGL